MIKPKTKRTKPSDDSPLQGLLRKAVDLKTARRVIAQTAQHSGLLLYHITDVAEQLGNTFHEEAYFPFDWSDSQSELFYKLMKAQSRQHWSGLDLKCVTLIVLGPSTHKLEILFSLFKRAPKNLNLVWKSSPPSGDMCVAPGPDTPYMPDLIEQGTPDSPDGQFRPLTQCLNPRSNKKSKKQPRTYHVPKFSLNLSTISASSKSPNQSTPDKSSARLNQSNRSIGSSKSFNSSTKRTPITKARKRYTPSPSPVEIRQRNSRILDGLEPLPKRTKLDKSYKIQNRPKVKARKSLQRFLANLFQQ